MAIARVPSNSNRNRRARDAIFIGNASKFERFLFFFFCFEAKGAYAAGLPTVCPIDRPIRLAFAIRPRWTRPRLKLRSPSLLGRDFAPGQILSRDSTEHDAERSNCGLLDCFVYDAGIRRGGGVDGPRCILR